ncbi:hypothetical protein CLV77_1363 [Brevirhabdus pacifica]|uniref:hypothetical protein n=1 Tax=Brevirhabdus pacifica TaxID=1267768 RepID=UPI000CCA0BED|nr:hypothetical protein [Brevirhabdus pacifica]PJJ86805.1 hypothetical protein CLV77_1363 [Brevirhabdus pacifica]
MTPTIHAVEVLGFAFLGGLFIGQFIASQSDWLSLILGGIGWTIAIGLVVTGPDQEDSQ